MSSDNWVAGIARLGYLKTSPHLPPLPRSRPEKIDEIFKIAI